MVLLNDISIEIIRKCPNNCIHCSSMSDEHCKEILDYETFIAFARDAAKLGAKTICLSGGEPFVHPRIVDIVSHIASLGLQTYIYTSGIVFESDSNKTSIKREVLESISSMVAKLIFNIEAATVKTYDSIMGTTGCFEKMKQSIRDANDLSIKTEAHFVPMKPNIGEVTSVIELCEEIGISKLSFLRLVMHGRALENASQIALSDENLEKLKLELESLKVTSALDIRIGIPLLLNLSDHKCEAAKGKLNIKYDGNVYPCEVFKNEGMSQVMRGIEADNIRYLSLCKIYSNSKYLNTVRLISEAYACDKHCETCLGQYLLAKGGATNGKQ